MAGPLFNLTVMPQQQISEIQVNYTSPALQGEKVTISSSAEAYIHFMELWDIGTIEMQECFNLLLLNRSNDVLGFYRLSIGSVSGTVVDPKLVFSVALKSMASFIILGHNHPSGNLKPSNADIDLTKKLKEGGKLLDLLILDHILLSRRGYYSFADEGLI